MNAREYNKYERFTGGVDCSATADLKTCEFNMNRFYAVNFEKQLAFVNRYNNDSNVVNIGNTFHIGLQKSCRITVNDQYKKLSSMNTREWNGHEKVRTFHDLLLKRQYGLDAYGNFMAAVLIELEYRYIIGKAHVKHKDNIRKIMEYRIVQR